MHYSHKQRSYYIVQGTYKNGACMDQLNRNSETLKESENIQHKSIFFSSHSILMFLSLEVGRVFGLDLFLTKINKEQNSQIQILLSKLKFVCR